MILIEMIISSRDCDKDDMMITEIVMCILFIRECMSEC